MGFDLTNKNSDDFEVLTSFLEERGITVNAYRVTEFFLREFLQTDPATAFPDEEKVLEITPDEIRKRWRNFEFDNRGFRWGLHPLVPSGISKELDLDLFESNLQDLLNQFPESSRITEVQKFRRKLARHIERVRDDTEDLKELLQKHDFWRLQKNIYLMCSKTVMQYFFKDMDKIDVFIMLKLDCYFPGSNDSSKDSVRKNLENLSRRYDLEERLIDFLNKNNAKEVMKVFNLNPIRNFR